MLFTSCEKDDDLISYYGDSKKSYVKTCDKKINVEVTRCVRNPYGNVVLSFSLSTTRLSDTYVSICTGPWDGSPGKIGSDDTGYNYTNNYPHGYSNIDISVGGQQVGIYGWGQQVTLSNKKSVYGSAVFHSVSSNAKTVTLKLPISSNTPNYSLENDNLQFVNIPIGEPQQ